MHQPVKQQVGGVFRAIRQPRHRGWKKHPSPQARRQLESNANNMKRRMCVQEGLRYLSALVVSRAVDQMLYYSRTPHMLRSRERLIAYLKVNNPRISRPYQMTVCDAEPDPASNDLIRISIQFYPDRYSRSRKSCLEVEGTLSFCQILSEAFASRRLRRQSRLAS